MIDNQHFRNTPQRRAILEELKKLHSHPTASEVYEAVRKHLPKISLGTVYRNLELLTEIGAINKIEIAGKEARFDHVTEKHIHVRCVRCSRVADVDAKPPVEIEYEVSTVDGWKVVEKRIEYVGVCPECLGQDNTGVN